MRCRDAKACLGAQRDNHPESSLTSALQEHLRECASCRAFEQQQRQLETVLDVTTPRSPSHVSTASIMSAIQQQKRISQQLEEIQQQQQTRIEKIRGIGTASAALSIFTLSCVPLLLLALAITQTDLALQALTLLNTVIDIFVILTQYVQTDLTFVTRDNLLLSSLAFAVVIMMGMWLRLMRSPQEA